MDRWDRRLAAAARVEPLADVDDLPPLDPPPSGDDDPGGPPAPPTTGPVDPGSPSASHDPTVGGDELARRVHADDLDVVRRLASMAAERPGFRAELPVRVRTPAGVVPQLVEVVHEVMGPVVRPVVARPDEPPVPVGPPPPPGRDSASVRSEVLTHVAHALEGSGSDGVALVLLDVDRFKLQNDALGEALGDELMRRLTARIEVAVSSGWVRQLGGDEVVVVLAPAPEPAELVGLAERVRAAVAEPVALGELVVAVTATVGVAQGTADRSAAGLLRDADTAVFAGKDRGRDRVEVFGRRLEARVARRLAGAQWLRRLLEERSVELHYQPVVSLETGLIVGVEALLRVRAAADDRTVSPAALVDAAEDVGLIAPLGRLVVERTVAQLAEWAPRLPPGRRFSASVNVSPLQLGAPGFAEGVVRILDEAGVAPDRLSLEITGSTLIEPDPAVDEALAGLADIGVALGIDELGTDRSSLGALRRFPLEFMKIDRGVVNGVDGDERDEAIVASAIGLAHQLGLRAIAVGVERDDQRSVLRRLGCDAAQGYLFAPPLPPGELAERL